MQEDYQLKRKKSLCRFFLRGLCVCSKEECRFSHGIDDLDYLPLEEGEIVEYDYLQDTDFTQRKPIKGQKVYINLYEFQQPKTYTLEQLNSDRPLRAEIRNKMHKQLFHDFMTLLEVKYPQMHFSEEFLLRQYTRVGFNKLMTRIKFSHLTDALCQGKDPRYFIKAIVMPPRLEQTQNYLFLRASEKQILDSYKQECLKMLKENAQQPDESSIKKRLFQISFENVHIPPLSLILKEKKTSFTDFLKQVTSGEETLAIEKIRLDPTIEEITVIACKYLNEVEDKIISWNDLFAFLSKELKINNGNILNQIKPELLCEGMYIFYFPMMQFIVKNEQKYPFEKESAKICQCSYKDLYDLSAFELIFEEGRNNLEEGESVDINDWQSLVGNASLILNRKILAIDLEGTLRKGGFVELIQLNNGKNTFIIDYYQMTCNKDQKTLDIVQKVLRNVLANPGIPKIFHDCRHDSLALHECLKSCIINVFDTSAFETLKDQLQLYKKVKVEEKDRLKQAKNAIKQCTNVRTLGLNEVLQRYEASHGINKNKEKFHHMWGKGEVDFFLNRPMNKDYRDYCIKDVLDLPEIHDKMLASVSEWEFSLAKWISAHYVLFGYQISNHQ